LGLEHFSISSGASLWQTRHALKLQHELQRDHRIIDEPEQVLNIGSRRLRTPSIFSGAAATHATA